MEKKLSHSLAWVAAVCTVAIWSETFISSKILLANGMTPAEIFFVRFLLAYVMIWFFAPKRLFSGSVKDELNFALLGFAGGSLYFFCENTALTYSTAANVAILVCCSPLLTALLMAIFYKEERMNLRQVAGSVTAFIGMALVVLNGELVLHLNPLGDLLAFCAAIAWASYSLLLKRVSGRYTPLFVTRKVFAYGLLTILPYFIFVEPFSIDMAVLSRPAVWGNLLYLGSVASMICYITWNWATTVIGTVRTTNLLYFSPFCTMIFAYLILDDRITWMAVAGAAILTAGMILAVRKKG